MRNELPLSQKARKGMWGLALLACAATSPLTNSVASAQQTIPGGFQSNVTGGIPGNMVYGPRHLGFGRVIPSTQLPAGAQVTLQTLRTAATNLTGLPATSLLAAGQSVNASFPDSPQRRRYQKLLSQVLADIADVNKSVQAAAPGDNSLHVTDLFAAVAATNALSRDLRALIQATQALAPGATPQQTASLTQTFNAIAAIISGLEQFVPALNQAIQLANSAT